MKARHKARTAALEVLYELDCSSHPVEEVIARSIEERNLATEQADFMRMLVLGVQARTSTLDNLIAIHAPEWPLDQMAIIDRNILRMALWEFAIDGVTTVKIAINEAVDLAKEYGSDNAPRFINGVLGALATQEAELKKHMDKKRKS